MKTTMKFFAALTIMVGFAVTTFGQDITASATVVTAVSISDGSNLQFGNVTPGNQKTIGTGTPTVLEGVVAGTTETAGYFSVSKGANSQVTLTFGLPLTLSDGSSHSLTINYDDFGLVKLGAIVVGGAPVGFSPVSGDLEINSTNYASAFAANGFEVRLGGTVLPDANQFPGTYTGTITLSAAYN